MYVYICVFTDSALRFPLRVCIDMAEVAIGCIGLRFLGHIVVRPVNVCIDFNCVGIASGRISLLYCYYIWLSSQSIFVYLLIAHILRWSLSIQVEFIGTVLNQPLGACIFSSIWAVLRQPLGVWVYICINLTVLILPLGACIEIATELMSFTISGTVMPLGVYNETAPGRMGSYFSGQY